MTRFRWGAATDVGRVRNANQDSFHAVEGFFVVADGMGGHRGGEVASSVAVESLVAALPVLSAEELLAAVQESNREVYWRAAEDPALRGMGTTMCVLALVTDGEGPALVLTNVGDSRIYRFAAGVLEQMTDDHSMVAELQRQGRITADEAATHPQRNILTRALGIDPAVTVDAWQTTPDPGTRWLLCSDGLFNEVDEATIAATLTTVDDPRAAADALVQLANEGGGRDNITVVVVDVLEDDAHHAAPVSTAPDVVREVGEPTPVEGTPVVVADVPAPAPVTVAPTRERRAARRVRLLAALVAVVLLGAVGALLLAERGGDDAPPPVPADTSVVATTTSSTSTSTTSTTSTSTTPPTTTTVAAPTTTA